MTEEKAYEPETIPDQPLPGEEEVASVGGGGAVKDTYSPPALVDKVITKTKVATVLLSDSLNTLSKRILGVYEFAKMGAIQIGEQKEGESGDIKISATGFLARNQAGETTFALDGSTGNAVFKGNVQAGSFISGEIGVGGLNDTGGRIIVKDAGGNIIILADSLGHHYYDIEGNELVKVDSGGFHSYKSGGVKTLKAYAGGIEGYGSGGDTFKFLDVEGGTEYGRIGYLQDGGLSAMYVASIGDNTSLFLRAMKDLALMSVNDQITLKAGENSDKDIALLCSTFKVNGVPKAAIVPTSKGYRALYCMESPEVWFMDFCRGFKRRKWPRFWQTEWVIIPSKLFMETIELPVIIMPTLQKGVVQIWGRRKGFKNKRFEEKTKKEFGKNREFWNTPNK